MVSVTSDVTSSASYQSASARAADKAALPDASQLASSFASLVDNNQPILVLHQDVKLSKNA